MAQVLVLEDEPSMRAFVVECLRLDGHEVKEAGNGFVGRRMMEEHPPELLVVDLGLPEQDGLQIIVLGARLQPKPKILAISGAAHLPVAKDLGADDILSKPFRRADLRAAVDRLLGVERAAPDAKGEGATGRPVG